MSYQNMPSSPIRLPKTQEQEYEIKNPQSQQQHELRYALQTGMSDPFKTNTPPNEFMGQLKQRMSVYYGNTNAPSSR